MHQTLIASAQMVGNFPPGSRAMLIVTMMIIGIALIATGIYMWRRVDEEEKEKEKQDG